MYENLKSSPDQGEYAKIQNPDEQEKANLLKEHSLAGQQDFKNEKQSLIQKLEAKGIYGYETNALEVIEKQTLLKHLADRIAIATKTRENETVELLNELYAYIQKNENIFPEFSHGTSSDALPDILSAGIYPRVVAKSVFQERQPMKISVGEGKKGGNFEEDDDKWTISAGAGQGGLGTCLAYAKINEEKEWNVNKLTIGELQESIKKYNKMLTIKNKDWIKEKSETLGSALERRQKGIEPDFGVVVGFTGTKKYRGIEELPSYQWVGSNMDISGTKKDVKRSNHELDSEVMIGFQGNPDHVRSDQITVIACPKEKIALVKEVLEKNRTEPVGIQEVQVISFEALEILRQAGYERIFKAKNATYNRIKKNLDIGKMREIRFDIERH